MSFTDNVKRVFGTITTTVGDAAKTTAEKTKLLAEIAKLNVKINSEEDKIKKAQLALGKQYYNDFEAGIPMEAETYLPICDEIKAAKDLVEQYKGEIEELKKQLSDKNEEEIVAEPAEKNEDIVDVVKEKVEDVVEAAEEKVAEAAETIEFTVVEDEKPEE